MKKCRLFFTKAAMIFAMLFFFGMCSMEANAETGATGYKIIVPSKQYENYYDDVDLPGSAGHDLWGLYELDGRPVYLDFSKIAVVSILENCTYLGADGKRYDAVGSYYAGVDGTIVPYNADTKPAIDAEINALLQSKIEEAKNLYGIRFNFKKGFDNTDNYHFASSVLSALASFPAGSVPVITNATVANTNKALTFRQKLNPSDNGVFPLSGTLTGVYTESANRVDVIPDIETISHELGHAMERALNQASGGQLRNTFAAMNGGIPYSKYYYYAGNEQIYDSFKSTMKPYVRRSYAATSFAEDFAETFSDALCYTTQELEEQAGRGSIAPQYLQKVLYVKQLFNQYAGGNILP